MFDCIIVGAGPSGTTAAYHLAKKGHSVLILEKELLPRHKTCGGGVSPAISQWLDLDFTPIIDHTINKVEFTWQMGDKVISQLEEKSPMWMVKRDQFDNFLMQKAQEQGAKIEDGTEVQNIKLNGKNWEITTNKGTFNSNYLIAADGANSQIAKMLKFKLNKPSLAGNLEITTPVSEAHQHTAYFDFGTLKNGYIWTFIKSDGYTINGGYFKGNGNAKELENKLKEYAQNLGLEASKGKYREYHLGLWHGTQKLHTTGALLVGEAARLVDPISGEGIRHGIFSGFQAAGAISQALAGYDNALVQYTEVINEELGQDLVLANRLGGLFYQFSKIAYRAGVKRPAFAKIMSKVLTGELGYRDITEASINRLKKSLLPGNN